MTTIQRWRGILRDRVPEEYALEEWRVTQLLVVTVLLVYNAEIVVRLALGAPTVRVAMGYSFLNYPEVAWPPAPVLHRDALHLRSNFRCRSVISGSNTGGPSDVLTTSL